MGRPEENEDNALVSVMDKSAFDILVTLVHPADPRTIEYARVRELLIQHFSHQRFAIVEQAKFDRLFR